MKKELYIKDIKNNLFKIGESLELFCWIESKRIHSSKIFFILTDSTGNISAIAAKKTFLSSEYAKIKKISCESSVKLCVTVSQSSFNDIELTIKNIEIIGEVNINLSPRPRQNFMVFSPKYTDYIQSNKHFFNRNRYISSVIVLKHKLLTSFRQWFLSYNFTEVDTPILTQTTLYNDNSTFSVDYFGTKVFLSQCASLYLHSALYSLEKVYTIAPAFRSEPSRSRRHNPEFHHVKGLIAFYDFEAMIINVEKMLGEVIQDFIRNSKNELELLGINCDFDKLLPPYSRITHADACKLLSSLDIKVSQGKGLSYKNQEIISNYFQKPVFITHLPRISEPFPYALIEEHPEFTYTADLIAPNGFGEILGIAEFISNHELLLSRLKEKGKYQDLERFNWYLQLLQYGSVPFCGFGLGLERLLRWLLQLPHIRDTFPFPRLYGRSPYP